MKKLSSWYAFMRFQESWYSNMGFLDAQDVWHWYSTVNPIPPQVQFEVQIEKAHLPVELWESYVFGSESNPNPWLAVLVVGTSIILPVFGMMLRIGEPPLKIYLRQKTNCTGCYISSHEGRHVKWGIRIRWKRVWNKLRYWNPSLARGEPILQILEVKWLSHTYGWWVNSMGLNCTTLH